MALRQERSDFEELAQEAHWVAEELRSRAAQMLEDADKLEATVALARTWTG